MRFKKVFVKYKDVFELKLGYIQGKMESLQAGPKEYEPTEQKIKLNLNEMSLTEYQAHSYKYNIIKFFQYFLGGLFLLF